MSIEPTQIPPRVSLYEALRERSLREPRDLVIMDEEVEILAAEISDYGGGLDAVVLAARIRQQGITLFGFPLRVERPVQLSIISGFEGNPHQGLIPDTQADAHVLARPAEGRACTRRD